jgi:4-diphosphocytidyl-2-C-methyl-D-erythritol kinase
VRIRESAPAKINLCLFLGPVRGDGRHELVTVYESVSLADELVVSDGAVDEVLAPGVEGPNLVADALAGLRRLGWQAPPLRVEIEKRIPVAAGMGGGSADAAAMLRLAPRLAPVSADAVAGLAAQLGADVPAQLTPGVALGTGAGEIVSPRPALAEHALVIVPQPIALSTAAVYREADRLGLPRPADELSALGARVEAALEPGARFPDELLVNDLQPAAAALAARIEPALRALREAGADAALVCGSGPTAAGIVWGQGAAERAEELARELASRGVTAWAATPVRWSAPG